MKCLSKTLVFSGALLLLGACATNRSVVGGNVATNSKQTAMAAASVPSASMMGTHKRPRPDSLSFVNDSGGYSPFHELIGQIWLRGVDQKTYVDYKSGYRQIPTDTRIVVQCVATREKLTFPVNDDFYGPAPACDKESDLVLAAE